MTTKTRIISLLGLLAFAVAGPVSAQTQVIKIGHSGPLSGSNAFAGKDNENGVRLAIEELNAKKMVVGGNTLRFELVSEDDQCDAKSGVNVAQKFVDDGVKFVMGPYCSGVAVPVSRVYSDAGVLMSTVGTNPKLTQSGFKNVYRIVASDNQIGSSMAIYAAKVLKVSKVGVIDDRTAFGQGLADEFKKEAKKQGLVVVGHEYTSDKSLDFTAILTKLKGQGPEAIFFGGYAPQGAPMVRQMKALALPAKLLGGDTLCSPTMGKLAPESVNGAVFCAQGGSILEKAVSGPAFQAKFKQRFNVDADVYAASYYDQVLFIAECMQKAGSTQPDKVGVELHRSIYKGVAANYSYDDNGNLKEAPITIFTFEKAMPMALASY